MLKSANEVIATGDTKAIVDFAIETNRQIHTETEDLKQAKEFLRKVAETDFAVNVTEKSVELPGNIGTATVTFPKPSWRPRKGVDLLACCENLPDEVFSKLFVFKTIVEFAPDFEDKLEALSAADRAVIDNLVEAAPTTPRVNLPR